MLICMGVTLTASKASSFCRNVDEAQPWLKLFAIMGNGPSP